MPSSAAFTITIDDDLLPFRPKNLKSGFKKPGPDGAGMFRAVLISGPPGIGKTTAAHLIGELAGYNVIEMNASDTRSKKLLEVCASASNSLYVLI